MLVKVATGDATGQGIINQRMGLVLLEYSIRTQKFSFYIVPCSLYKTSVW